MLVDDALRTDPYTDVLRDSTLNKFAQLEYTDFISESAVRQSSTKEVYAFLSTHVAEST